MNPGLGLMNGRFYLQNHRLFSRDHFSTFIKYAITIEALLLTPAKQWTYTLVYLRCLEINYIALSKC